MLIHSSSAVVGLHASDGIGYTLGPVARTYWYYWMRTLLTLFAGAKRNSALHMKCIRILWLRDVFFAVFISDH